MTASSVDAAHRSRRRVRPAGGVALGVSILVSAGLWTFVAGAASGALGDNSDLYWPEPFEGLLDLSFVLLPILLVVAIVLDIVAGVGGGRTRLVAIIGGVLLLSPLLVWGVLEAVIAIDGLFDK
jgi:hypothetical protein